jgi:excisionase family DNA binding protein
MKPGRMVSTKEVAGMLSVGETTIKRWVNGNLLHCLRTPGGHRKFLLSDVVAFAETNGYTVSGSQPPPMPQRQMEQLQIGLHTLNYERIAEVLKEKALQSDREGLEMLLVYLYTQHMSLPVVLDRVILPAFEEIGRGWEQGELGIDQEHAASHALTEALVRTTRELHRKAPNRKSALCACPEGELHELGLQGLAYSLECEGWKVHYLGSNTPLGALSSTVRAERPDLVCLSVSSGRHRERLTKEVRKLASSVHAHNGKLLIGGHAARTLNPRDMRCDHIAASIQDAIAYAREAFHLKPGPKKSSATR